jgi:hypothetical protein
MSSHGEAGKEEEQITPHHAAQRGFRITTRWIIMGWLATGLMASATVAYLATTIAGD